MESECLGGASAPPANKLCGSGQDIQSPCVPVSSFLRGENIGAFSVESLQRLTELTRGELRTMAQSAV